MKITKILTDILKRIEKGNTDKMIFGSEYGCTYFSPDGYKCYVISDEKFLIDLAKISNREPITDFRKKFFSLIDGSKDAYKTGEIVQDIDGKTKINRIRICNENTFVWINENHLKEFNDDCTFKISSPKNPVYVFENETLVGLVLPIYRKEFEHD